MKEILFSYAQYNFWADQILVKKTLSLSEEIIHKPMGSSFPSIFDTYFHIMSAEEIWWQRLNLVEHVVRPEKTDFENFKKVSDRLLQLSKLWRDWVKEANEKNLSHIFAYHNTKMEYYKQPVFDVLMHLFNHQTYHRGQIVTMMRQNGIDKIPATDYIQFSRKA